MIIRHTFIPISLEMIDLGHKMKCVCLTGKWNLRKNINDGSGNVRNGRMQYKHEEMCYWTSQGIIIDMVDQPEKMDIFRDTIGKKRENLSANSLLFQVLHWPEFAAHRVDSLWHFPVTCVGHHSSYLGKGNGLSWLPADIGDSRSLDRAIQRQQPSVILRCQHFGFKHVWI